MKNLINQSWMVFGLMSLASLAHAEGGDHGAGNGGDGFQLASAVSTSATDVRHDGRMDRYRVAYVCGERVSLNYYSYEVVPQGSQLILDVEIQMVSPREVDLDRVESNQLMVCAKQKTERVLDTPVFCDRPIPEGQHCQGRLSRRFAPVSARLSDCAPSLVELENKVLEGQGCTRSVRQVQQAQVQQRQTAQQLPEQQQSQQQQSPQQNQAQTRPSTAQELPDLYFDF